MGWGRNWGRNWGGGSESGVSFAIVSARASASNAVRVTFSKRPLLQSPLNVGDASNLTYWLIERTDKPQTITLLTSRAVADDVNTLEFIIVQRWPSSLAEYTITGSELLRAADKTEIIDPDARSADFFGAPAVIPVTERKQPLLDLLNPQTLPDQFDGGLTVGSDGDYLHEAGITLLKKILYREIFWAQGEAMHLAGQQFGLGVRSKEFRPEVDLITLQKQLQIRVLRHPEVLAANVTIELTADGQLKIGLRCRTKFGPLDLEYDSGEPNG